jgi:hypothetical protein
MYCASPGRFYSLVELLKGTCFDGCPYISHELQVVIDIVGREHLWAKHLIDFKEVVEVRF